MNKREVIIYLLALLFILITSLNIVKLTDKVKNLKKELTVLQKTPSYSCYKEHKGLSDFDETLRIRINTLEDKVKELH